MTLNVPIWRIRPTSAWDYEKARRFAAYGEIKKAIHCTVESPTGFHDIIDGHHRWVAALLLNHSTIKISV